MEDIAWLRPDGRHMADDDWHADTPEPHGLPQRRRHPRPRRSSANAIVDDSFLLLFNAGHRHTTFTLPDESYGGAWQAVVDTDDPLLANTRRRYPRPGSKLRLAPRSAMVLQCPTQRAP